MTTNSTIYGKGNSAPARLGRIDSEDALPQRDMYELLRWYYHNNGLYDNLRMAGHLVGDVRLKGLRNPAARTAEFFAATVWSGKLETALQIESPNANMIEAIKKLWAWSNWASERQVSVRTAAITGDTYLKAAQPIDGSMRVYLQRIEPENVTDKDVDERGYITYARIDVPLTVREGEEQKAYVHTEVWDRERVRVWNHQRSIDTAIDQLGDPIQSTELKAWGIDFVPIVHIRHIDIGGEYGLGAYESVLDKIDEANRQASRLSQMLFRHNSVTWALESNMMDASNRPMPAPRVGGLAGSGNSESVEVGGEVMLRLPGMAKVVPLVPNLNYDSALAVLESQMFEIKADLPELSFYELHKIGELSGKAIRMLMLPARIRALEVRGNHEAGLIRAQQMALTIGQKLGAWERIGIDDFGDFAKGDFEHSFADRPVIPLERGEIAELTKEETGAGMPLVTSLKDSGWSEDRIDDMLQDKADEKEAEQQSLATALLNAQDRLQGGAESNGFESVGDSESK